MKIINLLSFLMGFIVIVPVMGTERLMFSFEDSDMGRFNVKLKQGKTCIRGRVASVTDSMTAALSVGRDKGVASGTEFVVIRAGSYVADVKVTAVDAVTSTAKRVGGTSFFLAGDSIIQSASVHNYVNSNYTIPVEYNGIWNIDKGNASHGVAAYGLSRIKTLIEKPIYNATTAIVGFEVEATPWNDYEMFISGAPLHSNIFNTCGTFRALFPKDWTGYDLLRIDVFAKDVPHGIRVTIEDEEMAPMVVRNFQIASGQWTTIELDLRQAVIDRHLNLSKMTGLHVAVIDAPGKGSLELSCLMDNIRLAVTADPCNLPVVRDNSSLSLPDFYRHNTTPIAEVMPPIVPDRAALPIDSPRIIYSDSGLCFEITGFISAFDNNNMIAGFTKVIPAASPFITAYTMSTNDGGQTWKGLNAENGPTRTLMTYPTESSGRGESFGTKGDVLLLTSYCTGGGHAGMRGVSTMFSFDGSKWGSSPYRVVESDSRHCIAMHTAVKTPDGRLWTSFGKSTRLNTVGVDVHFSDNDGQRWKPSREYTSGVIPVSNVIPSPDTNCRTGQWAYSPSTDHQALVRWGEKSVACIMQTNAGYLQQPVYWTKLENGQWSTREEIPIPTWTNRYQRTWPGLKAVSLNGNELFLVHSCVYGVFHYKDGVWTREAMDVPFTSTLCVAGGKYVVAVGATPADSTGLSSLQVWQYAGSGKWNGPVTVARAKISLAMSKTPGFAAPSNTPENFVPIIWTHADTLGKNVVKHVRFPVNTGSSTIIDERNGILLSAAAPSIYPNPFSKNLSIRYGLKADLSLINIKGQQVWRSAITPKNSVLNIDGIKLAKGIYILNITKNGKVIRSFRVIRI